MRTDILTTGELGAYSRAHTRAQLAYFKANGSPAVAKLDDESADEMAARLAEHAASWHAAHDGEMARKATRAGESAVRKIYRDRVKIRDTYAALTITDPAHLERLTRDADAATARLAELDGAAPARKRTRKAPAPVVVETVTEDPTPVADVVPIREDMPAAPDTVPAPMPAMTRAARKQTRRELAAAMRAEGLKPEGAAWRERCAAAGLPVPELTTAGA